MGATMTLVNVWTRDLRQHVARMAATIEHRPRYMAPILDLALAVVREAETVNAIHITVADPPKVLAADVLHGLITIEDEPDFAFTVEKVHWERDGGIRIDAIPMIAYMRRATLPDWYVPDERFCT